MLNAVYICFYGLKCILTFLFLFCRDIHDFLFLPFLDDQDAHCRCGNLHSLLAPLQYIFCKNCLPSYNVSQNQLFCVTRKLQKVEIAIRSNIHHDDMYCKHFFLPHLFWMLQIFLRKIVCYVSFFSILIIIASRIEWLIYWTTLIFQRIGKNYDMEKFLFFWMMPTHFIYLLFC